MIFRMQRAANWLRPLMTLTAIMGGLIAATTPNVRAQPAPDSIPEPVAQALAKAEARADLQVSFTMAFRWFEDPPVVNRYDASSQRWTVIAGSPDALPAAARKKLKTYKRLEAQPGGLTYADYRQHLQDITLVEEIPARLVYTFVSAQLPKSMVNLNERVRTRLVIDRETGDLKTYLVEALAPFRANVMSSLNDFYFTQEFEKVFPDTPALMTRMHWRAKGKRFLQTINEDFEIIFSDFVLVTAP
ncbi:MAG: hypothetical protein AAFY83_02980 [Pseudomonadota bacterium]